MYLFVCDHTRECCPKSKQQQYVIKRFQLQSISSYLSQNKGKKNFSPLLLHSCLQTASSTVRVGDCSYKPSLVQLYISHEQNTNRQDAPPLFPPFLPPAGQMSLPAHGSLTSGLGALWSLQEVTSSWKKTYIFLT